MATLPTVKPWGHPFFRRVERTRMTWLGRFVAVALSFCLLWSTAGWWTPALGRSLVCEQRREPSDAILVDNFDPDYLLFERARELRRAGLAPRVLVPVGADPHTQEAIRINVDIAEVMASAARLGPIEIVPIRLVEPITLNAAVDIRQFMANAGLRSVIVATPLFRSRRALLVYEVTLGAAGIKVNCDPGPIGPVQSWTRTWHGVQMVLEQWIKLQYYRLYVLPLSERS